MIVGVTGCIGSGKSTVARILASWLSAEYLDTDLLCRDLMAPGNIGFSRFVDGAGREFLDPKGCLDRERLRGAVFSDSQIKNELESILHPLVRDLVMQKKEALHREMANCVVEVPLLFEVGWVKDFDTTVLVYVPEKISLERVMRRDGMSLDLVEDIISSQMNIEAKRLLADWIVDNSSTHVSTVCQAAYLANCLSTVIKQQF